MLLTPTFQGTWLVGAQRCWSVEIDHRRDIGAHDTLGDWCDAFAGMPDIDLATLAYLPCSGLPRQPRRESGTRKTAAEDEAIPRRGRTSYRNLRRTSHTGGRMGLVLFIRPL